MKKLNMMASGLAMMGLLGIVSAPGMAQSKMSSSKMRMHKAGTLSAQDRKFMMDAAHIDHDELSLAKLAMAQGGDKGKEYAQHMMDDHTKTSNDLMDIAKSKGVTLPAGPDAKGKALAAKLKKLNGGAFDKAYLTANIPAHKDAAMKFSKEANNGKDADVKGFAAKYLPTVKMHEPMAKDLLAGKSMDSSMSPK